MVFMCEKCDSKEVYAVVGSNEVKLCKDCYDSLQRGEYTLQSVVDARKDKPANEV